MYEHFLDCVDIVGEPVSFFSGYKQYVSTGAIDCDHIDTSKIEKVEYTSKPSRANLKVAKWDIIFAKMMETQKTLLISEENAEYIYIQQVFAQFAQSLVSYRLNVYIILCQAIYSFLKKINIAQAQLKKQLQILDYKKSLSIFQKLMSKEK